MPRHVNVQEGSQEDFNTYDFPIVKRPMKSISASAGGMCSVPFYFHNITFLLHITSNAKVSADSAFLKFLPCLLGPAPLTASTLSSHLAQVYCDLKTGPVDPLPWRHCAGYCRRQEQKTTLAALLPRSDKEESCL